MNPQAEVPRVHGTVVTGHVLVTCTACGPVGVTDATLEDALTQHLTDHSLEHA